MEELIPDLTHYAQGLDPSTFPLHIETITENVESCSIRFTVVTLENFSCQVNMDGRGFTVHSFSSPNQTLVPPESSLSGRQQEALSGVVYETIEALLMALSPRFEDFFGQELARKLEGISWDRFQEQEEMEDSEGDGDNTP